MSETQQTVRSASIISISAFVGAVAGFVLQLLVAAYFGADTDTDAFFMAQSTGELLQKLLLGGSIAAVFVPLFVERVTQGKRSEAWQLGLNLLHITAALLLIVLALLALFARPFVNFIAPGFDDASADLTVQLLYVLLPSFGFLFLVDLCTAMLHALKHFLAPALLRVVAPATSAIVLLIAAPAMGIYALALGVLIGSLLQFTLVFLTLVRLGLRYHFVLNLRDPALKHIWILVYPFIFSVLVTQAAGIVYRVLVSGLEPGSLAALKFAEKITQLLAIMFLSSVTAVIYPVLSEKAAQRDWTGMKETIAHACRLIFFITLPLIFGIGRLSDALISVIYQRGQFDTHDALMTTIALIYLLIGLTANGISSVFGHAVLALKRTKASVAVSITSQAVAISLFVLLVPRMGHAGLALGSSLVPFAIAGLYFIYLTRFIPNLRGVFWHPTYGKTIALTVLLFATIVVVRLALAGPFPYSRETVWLHLIIPGLIGGAVFLGAAHLWRIPEMAEVTALFGKKLWSKR